MEAGPDRSFADADLGAELIDLSPVGRREELEQRAIPRGETLERARQPFPISPLGALAGLARERDLDVEVEWMLDDASSRWPRPAR